MIVAERKSLEDILDALEGAERPLLVGCGTCVSVCLTGGEQEVAVLAAQLDMAAKLRSRSLDIETATVQRQCEGEFLDGLTERMADRDLILSLGCGAGTQLCAERFPAVPVAPAVDTVFVGANRGPGVWEEYCQACGDCVLHLTGGICPIARCSKSLLNGPCGGSSDGRCEIDPDVPCGWQRIHDRLAGLGRLELLAQVIPPKRWRASRDGGPRRRRVERAQPVDPAELRAEQDSPGVEP